jgi:hypothetical protein
MPTPQTAAGLIANLSPIAISELNKFARKTLQTRGGRAGSGLGSLLEALWGFFVSAELKKHHAGKELDLAWFPDHAYNDFACVLADQDWNPTTKSGELLRVEAKSMYRTADESKAHFDALVRELDTNDLLLVLIWEWIPLTTRGKKSRVAPAVISSFVGSAIEVAKFRDALHVARGGSFVSPPCPDDRQRTCSHIGEPLNADGKRERRTGPESRKPANASYAANFGGLVRMLKTNSDAARVEFRKWRTASPVVHSFVSFMHEQFPREEMNQYTVDEWRACARILDLDDIVGLSREGLYKRISTVKGFRERLRDL